jgi:hypothetical protein
MKRERRREGEKERGREGERERWGDGEMGRRKYYFFHRDVLPLSFSPSLLLSLSLSLCLSSCGQRDPEVGRRAAVAATLNKLRSCAPEAEPAADKLLLAVAAVTRQDSETSVQLIAHAQDEPVEFAWPVYSLSRGRWLINEQGRAYLLDEQCREYRLNDRRLSETKLPVEGRTVLQAGQSLTVTLSFPRLPDEVQMGVLVYAGRRLPFTFWPPALATESL